MNYSIARTFKNYSTPGKLSPGVKKVGKIAIVFILCVLFKGVLLSLWDSFKRIFEPQEIKDKRSYLAEVKRSIDLDSMSNSWAKNALIASQLYQAFEHSGTAPINYIWKLLSQLNKSDLLAVLVAYDIKTTHVFFFDDTVGTLYDHYYSELSDSELEEIRELYTSNDLTI